jgi:hypothetical protein
MAQFILENWILPGMQWGVNGLAGCRPWWGYLTAVLESTQWLRQSVSKAPPPGAPAVQIIPGRHSGFALPKRSLPSASPFRFLVVQMISASSCVWRTYGRDFFPAHRCRQRLVPGGSCGLNPILTRLLHGVGHGEAVRTANCLRTYLPAVFAVQRSHALLHVKRGRG